MTCGLPVPSFNGIFARVIEGRSSKACGRCPLAATGRFPVRLIALLILLATLMLAGPAPAETGKRVALVIGNANYTKVGPLANPVNDARAVADALRRLGFAVVLGLDTRKTEMEDAIRAFSTEAQGAETGLFYYAGHGIQVAGRNYLLPVDAALDSEIDLEFGAIDTDVIYRVLDLAADTRVIVLDACRDNPFVEPLSRSMGRARSTRLLGRGLARTEAAGGALIAFATEPGNVAYDGTGEHSPFTRALLNHIETPGIEINVMLTRVRAEVYAETDEKQRPWTSSSLIGEVYLAPGASRDTQQVRSETELELALWQEARSGETRAGYEAYLARFPEGAFAVIARTRLAGLPTESAGRTGAPDADTDAVPTAPPPHTAEASLDLDRTARREIQERLTALGHSTRGIDGIFGPGTRAAIGAWQRAAGRTVTGYLDAGQLTALEAASEDALAALRAERAREAADAGGRAPPDAGDTYRAVSSCGRISANATASTRDLAMIRAARACAALSGRRRCCRRNVTVTR